MKSGICQLKTSTVDRICASQVIPDMNACIKELVENALDSGGSSVSIRIRKEGSEIEVCDNGSGISKHDWDSVCLPHSTSKLLNDSALVNEIVSTHGFRGEALAAMCVLSGGLKITTRTSSMESGHILEFGPDGTLFLDRCIPISRSIGTTVTLVDLFRHSLPVRYLEAQKRFKKDLRVLSHMITELAIINCSKRFELLVDGKAMVVSNGNCADEYESYKKLVNGPEMVAFGFSLASVPDFRISGWISPPVPTPWSLSSDNKGLFQFMYLHSRPINLNKKLIKLLNGVYGRFEIRRVSFIIKFTPSENKHYYDINAAVDKRDIIWSSEVEEGFLEGFEKCIEALFENKKSHTPTPIQERPGTSAPPSLSIKRVYVSADPGPLVSMTEQAPGIEHTGIATPFVSLPKRTRMDAHDEGVEEGMATETAVSMPAHSEGIEENFPIETTVSVPPNSEENEYFPELAVSIPTEIEIAPPMNFGKEFFARMEIIGQFNNGFIIAKLPPSTGRSTKGELFLIDQHAANEKFLFEQYNASIKVNAQILIIPIKLRLKPWIEEVVLEHITQLRMNGFTVQYLEDANPGERVSLRTLPTLSGIGFNRSAALTSQDFLEVVHRLDEEHRALDEPGSSLLKYLPSVRASFASKACRTAVMVGDPLDSRKMKDIVSSLSTLQQPWNCPHGRPTMKHLLSIDDLSNFSPVSRAA